MTIERCSMNISPKKLFNVHCSMLNCHLKICGRGRVIAVPVDDFTVLVFQESQKTAVRSILEAMASPLDGVAPGPSSQALLSRPTGIGLLRSLPRPPCPDKPCGSLHTRRSISR